MVTVTDWVRRLWLWLGLGFGVGLESRVGLESC